MSHLEEKNTHRTFVANNNIILEVNGIVIKEIPIKQIKVVVEYTNDKGPFLDDWYVLIYYGLSDFFEMSMNTNRIEEMLKELGIALNIELYGSLADSIDWKSNILYPKRYSGLPLWIRQKAEPKTIWDRVKSSFGLSEYELKFTKIANELLDVASR